jgi:endonuclease/exonuclease/phosphatase family metal-dependent hydrolase
MVIVHTEKSAAEAIQAAWRARAAPPAPKTRVARHALRLMSFNSNKLRVHQVGLEIHWLALVEVAATCDCIVVQEVPAEGRIKRIEDTRAYGLVALLNAASKRTTWNLKLSESSGPGNFEVHAVLYVDPIEVLEVTTHFRASATALDHAPFTIKLRDPRFASVDDQTWVLTSVHFPPRTRSKQRDTQLNAFLRTYTTDSAFRLDTPLTLKGAKDAKQPVTNHVIAGDFNKFPAESESFGLCPIFGEEIATSAGMENYDNFLVTKHTKGRFLLQMEMLELATTKRKGSDGISDHHPIMLSLVESPRAKRHQQRSGSARNCSASEAEIPSEEPK